MKNKWSNVRRPPEQDESVKTFYMEEFIPPSAVEPAEDVPPHDCSELQHQAFERGRQAGFEEGRAACQSQVEEALQRTLRLANQIGRARVAALEDHERDVVEIALAISKKLLLRDLELDKDLVIRQVRQVLELLPDKTLVTLKVHPQDYSVLHPIHETLREELHEGDHVVLQAHEDVDPGGCLIEQAGLLFDARLSQQLAVIAGEFGLEASRL